ncbi:MAG: hypothetical protein KDB35_20770 [Acidimicrobiales bacterium]|nr:hypothetical protein [Acidimicrobiales bacterium]
MDQTLLLAPTPLRDKAGLLVRLWSVPVDSGVHTLVAVDHSFHRPHP